MMWPTKFTAIFYENFETLCWWIPNHSGFHNQQICQIWEKLNVILKKIVIQILQVKVIYGTYISNLS